MECLGPLPAPPHLGPCSPDGPAPPGGPTPLPMQGADVQVGGAGPAGVAVLLLQQLPQLDVEGRLDVADGHGVVGPFPAALHVTHHYRGGVKRQLRMGPLDREHRLRDRAVLETTELRTGPPQLAKRCRLGEEEEMMMDRGCMLGSQDETEGQRRLGFVLRGLSLQRPLAPGHKKKNKVVFVDPSGHLNMCADMTACTYKQPTPGVYSPFVSPVFRLLELVKLQASCKKLNLLSELMDHSGNYVHTALPYILSLLQQGLGQRIHLLSHSLSPDPEWSLEAEPPKHKAQPPLSFGLILRPEHAASVLERGPPADSPKAAAFRQLWGPRSELRRFQDGAITEAVLCQQQKGPQAVAVETGVSHAPDLRRRGEMLCQAGQWNRLSASFSRLSSSAVGGLYRSERESFTGRRTSPADGSSGLVRLAFAGTPLP
ncbi:hypothetical protein CRUP_009952 [Coryphaenoides rupestris]|nr:hypothetical protein CRUP_009952 [Coryphaenoides rupestris]